MTKSKVALIKCASYNAEEVHAAIMRGFDLIGGAAAFAKAGEKILLKPNMLSSADPEAAVTTHPSVFEAVIRAFADTGAKLSYGDSPAFHKTSQAVKKCGYDEVAKRLNVPLADFETTVKTEHPSPLFLKTIPLAKGALDADGIVSISKLKAHGLTRLTGAIKNQYGCIPGLTKGKYHTVAPMVGDFSAMLVDINTLLKPRLYIMDAIVAMEGNGPNSGDPKKIGCLIMSTDPVALDATACRIVDCNPHFIPTNLAGEKAKLGTWHAENIEIVVDKISDFIDRSFKIVRSPAVMVYGGGIAKKITAQLSPKPVIKSETCIKCGRCVEICPVDGKAVNWKGGTDRKSPPVYEYEKCIRCYCCQETCPEGAITIYTPPLSALLPALAFLGIFAGVAKMIAKRTIRFIQGKK